MLAALGSVTVLGLGLGGLLGVAARYLRVDGNPLVAQVAERMPGSQCGQCGYPGCGPAAEAIASGAAAPTICPPGGRALAQELAGLLGVPLDLSGVADQAPLIANIHEALCIGCCKCFKRCPTDAILGANNMIHSVFEDACTGCAKCFEVCPTECIEMRPMIPTLQSWFWPSPASSLAG
jgi:H+/Na+-translocating ferredoxin:NAD+ oxidoreductase subunit B